MGFNLMVWGFVQYDSYNHVITSMSQRDQQAISENIVPINPGVVNVNFAANNFSIIVNNLGGVAVTIASIYVLGISGPNPYCKTGPCVAGQAPSAAYYFTNGNIPTGVINYHINFQGLAICYNGDSNSYKIILSTSRGRQFSLFCPWPVANPSSNGGGVFVTNIGPLAIYFDFKSFNYTQGNSAQPCYTTSCSAFCMPSTNAILFVKITNTATDNSVTLGSNSLLELQPYNGNGIGSYIAAFILGNSTINPAVESAYSLSSPYVLAPSNSVTGAPTPQSTAIVKFGASGPNALGSIGFKSNTAGNWLTFIGFYYQYRGLAQGETIPFMDFDTNSPNCFV